MPGTRPGLTLSYAHAGAAYLHSPLEILKDVAVKPNESERRTGSQGRCVGKAIVRCINVLQRGATLGQQRACHHHADRTGVHHHANLSELDPSCMHHTLHKSLQCTFSTEALHLHKGQGRQLVLVDVELFEQRQRAWRQLDGLERIVRQRQRPEVLRCSERLLAARRRQDVSGVHR